MSKRPFYLIAHQCNDLSDINSALEAGANGLELDVWLTTVDGANYHWFAAHDSPGLSSTRLDSWLNVAAGSAKAFEQKFAIIYFDIKTPTVEGLIGLRTLARSILPPDLNVLYSISTIDDAKGFGAFSSDMRFNEGLTIDAENDFASVASFFAGMGVANYWYGDGITSFAPEELTGIQPAIIGAVQARDTFFEIKKVNVWTLAEAQNIKTHISMKVDAILVEANPAGVFVSNHITDTVQTVNASNDVRFAVRSDPAFTVANPGTSPDWGASAAIGSSWRGWPSDFLPIDAAIAWPNGPTFFFKGDRYLKYSAPPNEGVAAGYPTTIAGNWSGWPADFFPLDAAIFWPNGKAYFFKGDQFLRYTPGSGECVDEGYPMAIKGHWTGWPDDFYPLDAAVMLPDGYAYFFKGDQYLKYFPGDSHTTEGAVGGPKAISAGFDGWPSAFSSMDAAFVWLNNWFYVMKGTEYVRNRLP